MIIKKERLVIKVCNDNFNIHKGYNKQMGYTIDFDGNFKSDDEIRDEIDNVMNALCNMVVESESKLTVVNSSRIKQLELSYKILKYIVKGKKIKITYALHEPFESVGYISIEGRDITFTNTELFLKVAEYASNMDIYPKTNGNVQIDFCFYGLKVSEDKEV